MPIPTPPPFPNFFRKNPPPSLTLTPKNRLSTSSSSSVRFSPFTPISTCATPEIKAFLSHLNIKEIEDIITYNPYNLKNGQNGIVKEVSLRIQNETRKLIRKQGGFGVEQENKMTEATKCFSS